MKKHFIIPACSLTLIVVSLLVARHFPRPLAGEEHYANHGSSSSVPDANSRTAATSSAQRNAASSAWRGTALPAQAGHVSPEPAKGSAGDRSDELKARQLAEQLGLSGERLERMLPLLRSSVEQERLATIELLKHARFSHTTSDPYFLAALQQRARISVADQSLREQLSGQEWDSLVAFDAEMENNVLNLLANENFTLWDRHLDFGPAEHEAYQIFFDQSQQRMQSAMNTSLTPGALAEELATQDKRTFGRLAAILPEEKVATLRIMQEASTDPALRQPAESP